jgi:predicted nucleic acid-binding protein
MMVLVDTSVWIHFLSGREPYASQLDALLGRDEVLGNDLIFGELLIGDRGGRVNLLDSYSKMQQSATIPHAEIVDFTRKRRLPGRGIGWIDVHLLASAVVAGSMLWTADQRLMAVAMELGVAFKPTQH